jgi:hypothetical protein
MTASSGLGSMKPAANCMHARSVHGVHVGRGMCLHSTEPPSFFQTAFQWTIPPMLEESHPHTHRRMDMT